MPSVWESYGAGLHFQRHMAGGKHDKRSKGPRRGRKEHRERKEARMTKLRERNGLTAKDKRHLRGSP